jgi:signal transduction histidine kinase
MLPSLALEPASSPADAPLPMSVVQYARLTRQPVIIEDVSVGAGKLTSDPYFTRHPTRSVLCLPIVRNELVGLLYLENDLVAGAFTRDRLTALSLLAAQAAISIENTRLLFEERQARQRSSFLAEEAARLSESLDFDETLTRLGRLCVRSLADWCVLDVLEGSEIRRLSTGSRALWIACADPAKEPVLDQLRERHPPRWDSPHPVARCLRTGSPVLVPSVTDEQLRELCEDEEHLRLIRTLVAGSVLAVPLAARGQAPLGVLTLVSGTKGRYGRVDLELVREVAHRAAIALDNARLHRETERAVRVRDEFLQVASHELRTPVAALMLSLDRLLRASRSGRSVEPGAIERATTLAARQGARRAARRSSDVPASRWDRRRSTWPRSISRRSPATWRRFEAELARAGCSLSIRCSRPVVGRWDGLRIDQVITNLISNAIKFGAGKPIELEIGEEAGTARLSVRDHGIGIDLAQRVNIFDRFQRAVSPAHYGGLGLGLYLGRRIVEAHGGSIRVESEPGAGATFTVELPCAGNGPGRASR